MVTLNHGFCTYRGDNPLGSYWGVESIYVLCYEKYIDGMRGDKERFLFFNVYLSPLLVQIIPSKI